jgi:hypothetical protein
MTTGRINQVTIMAGYAGMPDPVFQGGELPKSHPQSERAGGAQASARTSEPGPDDPHPPSHVPQNAVGGRYGC